MRLKKCRQQASKMMLSGKLNIAQGVAYSEDQINFYGTQIQLMQSTEVKREAEALEWAEDTVRDVGDEPR